MSDNIVRYTITAADGKNVFCPSCAKIQRAWVGETEGGEQLTACAVCQRITKREPIDHAIHV